MRFASGRQHPDTRFVQGVPAFFAHLLFVDDPIKATSAEQWHDAIHAADQDLGLTEVAMPWAVHVCLPASSYDELTAATV